MIRALICCILAFILASPGNQTDYARAKQAMGRRIPAELNFTNAPVAEVLDQFVAITGAKLNVRWDVLAACEITRSAPVTARLRDATSSKFLSTVLNDAGGGETKLSYCVEEDGTILITTADELIQTHALTIDYDIEDLVADRNPAARAAKVQELIDRLNIGPDYPWREPSKSARAAGFGAKERNGILTVRELKSAHEEIPLALEALRDERAKAYIKRMF